MRARFEQFVAAHPALTAKQTRLLNLLQNHIAKYGAIEIERLYEDPFTMLHVNGIDGVFPREEDADALIQVIQSFSPPSDICRDTEQQSI